MLDSVRARCTVVSLTWGAAWVALVLGQVHALARHATADGREDLDSPLTRAWAVPAARALQPLIDWGDPDTVYLTWGKLWVPVFVLLTLCAVVVRRHRGPAGLERWAWRVALTGYVVATLSVTVEYGLSWTGYSPVFEVAFLALSVPGLLLTMLGSTLLGVALLRSGARPRLAGWLLALALPLTVLIVQVTSMGSAILPVLFAIALLGRAGVRDGEGAPGGEGIGERTAADPTTTQPVGAIRSPGQS